MATERGLLGESGGESSAHTKGLGGGEKKCGGTEKVLLFITDKKEPGKVRVAVERKDAFNPVISIGLTQRRYLRRKGKMIEKGEKTQGKAG